MDMKEFKDFIPNKFLVVLGKMQATILGKVEKHLKSLGYNSTEFLVMYAVAEHGALTIQDIAARIFVTSGNMTYTIDKLEKRSVIKRIPCPEDKRRIHVDFTEEGRKVWDMVIEDHARYLDEIFKDINEDIIMETISNMKTIGKSISK